MPAKQIIAPSLAVVIVLALLIQLPLEIATRASEFDLFGTIVDIRRILLDDHVEPPDEDALQRAMIAAMVEAVDDPYTQYVPPVLIDEFNKELRGNYVGIGAEVNVTDGFLTIVTPMADSPALRAGVRAGDVVLAIEGVSTFEQPISDSIERLTGEEGTEVQIRVRHLDGIEEDLTILRERIITRTVKGFRRVGEEWNYCVSEEFGISYIRVTQFNSQTVQELRSAIGAAKQEGMSALILDLRDNPGGGLPAAVGMSDLFLREGKIVSVRPRNGDEEVYRARPNGTVDDFPMIVLINSNSASASEIVSGALQENGRAKVMGRRTYGKGSVQEVRPLRYDAGTLKFTTAYYYLPSGRNLNRKEDSDTWGVDPDPGFVVPESDDAYVERMRARQAFEVIQVPEAGDSDCSEEDWIRQNLKDETFALAVGAMKDRLQFDAWDEVTDADTDETVFTQEMRYAMRRRARLLEELARTEQDIEKMHARAELEEREPLLPPETDLKSGTIVLRDAEGREVARYTIESGNVELALGALELTPAAEGE